MGSAVEASGGVVVHGAAERGTEERLGEWERSTAGAARGA